MLTFWLIDAGAQPASGLQEPVLPASIIEIPVRLSLDTLINAAEKTLPYQAGNWGTWKDWLFLAMAHHRLGQEDESRRVLAEARQIMEAELPKSDSGDLGSHWQLWIIRDIIRREAETLIGHSDGPTEIDD